MKVSITAVQSAGHGLLVLALATVLGACTQIPGENASRAQATVEPSYESGDIWEDWSDFSCPTDQFLIARWHSGEETGRTRYYCGKAFQFEAIPIRDHTTSGKISEDDGIRFVCPENQVMTGRRHDFDENGPTWYYCGTPYDYWGKPMQVVPEKEWIHIKNEQHTHTAACPENMAMIGRWHLDDEQGPTEYLCARLF